MRYTKYKYKKNNESLKLISSIIITIVVAISIGNFGAKWIIGKIPKDFTLKNQEINQSLENTQVEEKEEKESIYSVIQGGYFSNIENANYILTKLSDFKNSFIFKDEVGKFRVIVDVVKKEDSEALLNDLNARGIDSAKVDYSIKEGDNSEGYICEIIKGQFEIIDTFKDETVKEIEIIEFKEWVSSLDLSKEALNQGESINEDTNNEADGNNNITVLEDYKSYIQTLPDKAERENVKDYIKNIYSVIINIKK